MNPTVGLLLPLMLGQPAGPLCGPLAGPMPGPVSNYASYSSSCAPCGPVPRSPLMAYMMPPVQFKQLCPPSGPPAPVLAVRAVLAEGMKINPTPADSKSPDYPTGTVFGFRPGYRYPLRIDNLPGREGESLFPVLEVRGSIVPRPGMKYMEYPATITLTAADVEKALNGRFITKVIYLEDPSRAVPQEASPDKPIEVSSETVERAVAEAELNGRPVAILRIGDRKPSTEELVRQSVEGTVLVPGTTLGPAATPPQFGCSAVPLYDPILGPNSSDIECFINGGDVDSNLGIGPDGTVQPLRNTNTVAEYTAGSRRKFTTSNQVCICVPRFIIRRAEVGTGDVRGAVTPTALWQVTGHDVFRQRAQAQEVYARIRVLGLDGRVRASQLEALVGLHAFTQGVRLQAHGKVQGVASLFKVVELDEISNFPGQLVLTKTVEPAGAVKQGDELTVTLRYYNNTRQPVSDLILSDSLSARLEYIAGSAAADRPSNVTLADNEVGSQIIRFEIPGPIPPAANGVVVFRVKVR